MSRGRKMVEERWGYPFWEVVRDFAEQGLDKAKVSRALGVNYNHLNALLNENPDRDPFPPSNRQISYLRDTGETFKAAVLRMHAAGVRVSYAARDLGFSDATALRRHLDSRGMTGLFVKPDPIEVYCQAHSVTLPQALKLLRDAGLRKTAASKALGLYHVNVLTRILADLGLPGDYFRQPLQRDRSISGSSRKPSAEHKWRKNQEVSYQAHPARKRKAN